MCDMAHRSEVPANRTGSAVTDPFGALHREMDRLFEDFSRGQPWRSLWGDGAGMALRPVVDIDEGDDGTLTVTAELPGIDDKDIEVQVDDSMLTIRGEKRVEREEKKQNRHVSERSYGAFARRIALPFEADPDTVTARFDKGVLTVTVPRPPEAKAKARRIDVTS
jgi:HSP20 family protein